MLRVAHWCSGSRFVLNHAQPIGRNRVSSIGPHRAGLEIILTCRILCGFCGWTRGRSTHAECPHTHEVRGNELGGLYTARAT